MNSAGNEIDPSPSVQNASLTILRRGFLHPRSQRRLDSHSRGHGELPEITGRACTWDAIDEDDTDRGL